jgi:mannosyltransferase
MLGSQAASRAVFHPRISQYVAALRSRTAWEIVALVSVLMLGTVARLHDLGEDSLWLDEAFSVYVAKQPFGRMLEIITRHDTPPPLYYTLLHAWLALGLGDHARSVRLLSAALGIASICVIYLCGRAIGGPRVGLVAALLLAVSPFRVWYSQEARMYALLALLCGQSVFLLWRALTYGSARAWIGYALTTTLALYTQISATFFIFGEGVAALLFLVARFSQAEHGSPEGRGSGVVARIWHAERRTIGMWLASQLAIALLWLPWLPFFLRQSETYQSFWIPAPTWVTVKQVLFDLTSIHFPHWLVPMGMELLVIGGVLLALLGGRGLARPTYAFFLALFLVPIIAMYAVSQVKPVFVSRALIYVSMPYILLIAAGLASLKRWHVGAALVGLVVLLNLVSLYRIYGVVEKEQWDRAASHVLANATPHELVLFVAADAQIAFDYYAERDAKSLERRGLPVDVLTVGRLEPQMEPQDLARMDALIEGRDSFWLVQSHTAFADPLELARRHADESYRRIDARELKGVTVYRYDASGARAADRRQNPAR